MLKIIKYYLRNNSFYVKFFQSKVNDCRYFLNNLKFYVSNFNMHNKEKELGNNTVFFVLDPKQEHPGLADRLKIICCIYHIAKKNGFDFKLIHDYPFNLSDYLDCNKINWIGNWNELNFSFKSSRMLAYNGMRKIPVLSKKINQYIIYYYIGKNILQCNHIDGWEEIWRNCYKELFKSSAKLQEQIDLLGFEEKSYNAVHFRFVNALENFEDGVYNSLKTTEEKEMLIDKCLKGLQNIMVMNGGKRLLIFSDSNMFLKRAKEAGYFVLDGTVAHISFNSQKDAVMKTFVDYYMISRADKVYRVKSKELYAGMFSFYASLSGNANFYDFEL